MKKITFIVTMCLSSLLTAQFSNDFSTTTASAVPSSGYGNNEWYTWSTKVDYVTIDTVNDHAVMSPPETSTSILNIKNPLSAGEYVVSFSVKWVSGTKRVFSVFVRDNTNGAIAYQDIALNDNSNGGVLWDATDNQINLQYKKFRIPAQELELGVAKTFSFNTSIASASDGKAIMFSHMIDKDGGVFHFDNFTVTSFTASADNKLDTSLKIYPNPASDEVYVSATEAIESVSLTNALGQTVPAIFNGSSVDVAALPNDVYVLTVVAGGKSSSQKVIVD
ncbi:MAG: T9SS type A sorting domain-containing protein [Flavicella sp.]